VSLATGTDIRALLIKDSFPAVRLVLALGHHATSLTSNAFSLFLLLFTVQRPFFQLSACNRKHGRSTAQALPLPMLR